MKTINYLFLLVFVLLVFTSNAQKSTPLKEGKMFVLWGYNRTMYGNSDIHFKGNGYDYTLKNVRATDSPTSFTADVYLNPLKFTIPQFNFRAGYYLSKKYSLSVGWDHLKYVLDNSQVGIIDGTITDEARDQYSKDNSYTTDAYIGSFNNEEILLSRQFMKYEHTDGLNFIRISIDRYDELYATNSGKFNISLVSSLGVGPVLPWTDFTHLSGKRYTNRLHFSGFAMAYHSGVKFEFSNKFFIQSNIGAGFVTLPWIETKKGESDSAKQSFVYGEWNCVAGFYFNPKRIFKSRTKEK